MDGTDLPFKLIQSILLVKFVMYGTDIPFQDNSVDIGR